MSTSNKGKMRRFFVRLDEDTLDKLIEIAKLERRHPADEAALMIMAAVALRYGSGCAEGKVGNEKRGEYWCRVG